MGASTLFWFEGDKFDHRSQRRIVSHGYSEVFDVSFDNELSIEIRCMFWNGKIYLMFYAISKEFVQKL